MVELWPCSYNNMTYFVSVTVFYDFFSTLWLVSPHFFSTMSIVSLFLPSRPPPTPACYLHPHLPHAALTHQHTPLPICRLRPRPAPTLVSVFSESVWLLSNCHKNGFCLCLPHRAHISWGVSAGAGSGNWAAGHESQPGSVLGQITVSDRQSMPFGAREEGESVVKGWNYLKKNNRRGHTGNSQAQNRVPEGPRWATEP